MIDLEKTLRILSRRIPYIPAASSPADESRSQTQPSSDPILSRSSPTFRPRQHRPL
jgi:hypothetical protein